MARGSLLFLICALWAQLFLGMNVIWNNVPINLASMHQMGAMTILSAVLFSLHTARRCDVRHIKNLVGKLRIEDPKAYIQLVNSAAKNPKLQ